jgi:integrase
VKTYPLKDISLIYDIGDYLIVQGNQRNYLLYMFGLHVGPRVEEYLPLKVREVLNSKGQISEFIMLSEHKKNKVRRIKLNKEIREILKEYVINMPPYKYLFESEKLASSGANKPISRQQAYNILADAGAVFGVRLSPHALRKTFALALFEMSDQDILVPMQALGHASPKQTRDYLCLTDERVHSYIEELSFRKRK